MEIKPMADLYITDAKCILAFYKVKTEYQWRTTAIRLEFLVINFLAEVKGIGCKLFSDVLLKAGYLLDSVRRYGLARESGFDSPPTTFAGMLVKLYQN